MRPEIERAAVEESPPNGEEVRTAEIESEGGTLRLGELQKLPLLETVAAAPVALIIDVGVTITTVGEGLKETAPGDTVKMGVALGKAETVEVGASEGLNTSSVPEVEGVAVAKAALAVAAALALPPPPPPPPLAEGSEVPVPALAVGKCSEALCVAVEEGEGQGVAGRDSEGAVLGLL